jgi:cyclopropane fatty-acyl-phospholipid synthase-like methyltransferase
MLPYSEACERNQQPILAVLARHLIAAQRVLEVGSGTAQHAVYFARHLRRVTWQPSDRLEALGTIAARIAQEGSPNLRAPLALDVASVAAWPPPGQFDALYSANTLHIMSWQHVQAMFAGVSQLMAPVTDALLFIYGPFKYRGGYTSASNEAFDAMLRERDADSGIRDFEAVDSLAVAAGFALLEDNRMPANNQLLVWQRKSAG